MTCSLLYSALVLDIGCKFSLHCVVECGKQQTLKLVETHTERKDAEQEADNDTKGHF